MTRFIGDNADPDPPDTEPDAEEIEALIGPGGALCLRTVDADGDTIAALIIEPGITLTVGRQIANNIDGEFIENGAGPLVPFITALDRDRRLIAVTIASIQRTDPAPNNPESPDLQ